MVHEVLESFTFSVASGRPKARQQAAVQVVDRSRAAALLGVARDLAPCARDVVGDCNRPSSGQPGLECCPPRNTPIPHDRPLGGSPNVTTVIATCLPVSFTVSEAGLGISSAR